eukprot:6194475-Pleurochrysis_carterae.AAC.3
MVVFMLLVVLALVLVLGLGSGPGLVAVVTAATATPSHLDAVVCAGFAGCQLAARGLRAGRKLCIYQPPTFDFVALSS